MHSAFKPVLWSLCGLVLVLATAGCESMGSRSSSVSWPRTGDVMTDARTAVEQAPLKDRVLWQYRGAASAIRKGQFVEAKKWLDDALLTLGGIHAADPSARKARGLFRDESRKKFLGEPYERSMAYFYRGVLYWMDGELDNARACFKSGQFEDSDAEDKSYAGDYVMFDLLEAWTTTKLAGDGADPLKRAVASAKGVTVPTPIATANLALFLEVGRGPVRQAGGEYGEQLRFRDGTSDIRAAMVKVAGQTVRVETYDSLTYQATTRGGRVMDHILGNKAVFKSATDVAGNVGIISGAVLATGRDTQEIGLGLLAAGLVGKIVSAATTPQADTRSWDNLPERIGFAALKVPPGSHQGTVEFLDEQGRVLGGRTRGFSVLIPDNPGKDSVVFISDRSE